MKQTLAQVQEQLITRGHKPSPPDASICINRMEDGEIAWMSDGDDMLILSSKPPAVFTVHRCKCENHRCENVGRVTIGIPIDLDKPYSKVNSQVVAMVREWATLDQMLSLAWTLIGMYCIHTDPSEEEIPF